MRPSRFLISNPVTAKRLGRTVALVELPLSDGFAALPVPEQERELEEAFSAALDHAKGKVAERRLTRAG